MFKERFSFRILYVKIRMNSNVRENQLDYKTQITDLLNNFAQNCKIVGGK